MGGGGGGGVDVDEGSIIGQSKNDLKILGNSAPKS